jgi:hypothetical protein
MKPTTEAKQLKFTALEEYEDRGSRSVAISSMPLPPSLAHHTAPKAEEKGKLDVEREKEG